MTSLDACKHSTEAWHCLRPRLHEYGSTTRLHYYRPGNTFIAGSNGIIGTSTGWLLSWYSRVLDDYSLGTNLVMDGYSLSIHMVLDGYSLGTHLVLGGYSLGTHLYWMVTLLVLTCTGRLLTWYSSGIGRLLSWYSPVLDGYSLDTHLYWMVTLLVLTWYWMVTLLVLTCTGWLLSWYSPGTGRSPAWLRGGRGCAGRWPPVRRQDQTRHRRSQVSPGSNNNTLSHVIRPSSRVTGEELNSVDLYRWRAKGKERQISLDPSPKSLLQYVSISPSFSVASAETQVTLNIPSSLPLSVF